LSKIIHSVATTEEMLTERLTKLFSDNMWKLYGLSESMVLDRGPQFSAELMRKLNKMLGSETKLLTSFYSQTDG